MPRPLVRALAAAGALLVSSPAQAGPRRDRTAPLQYALRIPQPHTQYVELELTVPGARGKHVDLAMPAWTPGSYKIRDFARHVYDLRAESLDGKPLSVDRLDKQTWRVHHRRRGFRVRYRVFASEPGVRTSHVDDTHASLNGASIFLYLVDDLGRPLEVVVEPPAGWTTHTALPARGAHLAARDYDTLVDSPFILGTPRVKTFEVDGTRFELVFNAPAGSNADLDRLVADTRKVVAAQGRMMGGFPMKRYVFLANATGGGGGLEHHDSTMIMLRPRAYDAPDAYRQTAGLVAHEFFHLWNVKRIHDVVLGPFDYAREVHSTLLWLHEGVTSTVSALSLVRAGIVSPESHLQELAKGWTRYLQHPGRDRAPLRQHSFLAWTRQYQPAENHRNVAISYYDKGAWVGVALDLELRLRAHAHGQTGSVVGMLRRLMQSHGSKGRGITPADVVDAATEEAGEDMAWFFEKYVDGTAPLDVVPLLKKIGVDVKEEAPAEDAAGYSGLELSDNRVRNVIPGSPADSTRIMRGDEILAVNGVRADRKTAARLADHAPGAKLELTVFRRGRLLTVPLTLAAPPARTFKLSLTDAAKLDGDTKKLREAWLQVFENVDNPTR